MVRKGSRIYVVLPTRLLMQSPQGKLQAENDLLGISEDRGATWTFADGAGLQDAGLRAQLFPDLPAELVLPAVNPPVVVH